MWQKWWSEWYPELEGEQDRGDDEQDGLDEVNGDRSSRTSDLIFLLWLWVQKDLDCAATLEPGADFMMMMMMMMIFLWLLSRHQIRAGWWGEMSGLCQLIQFTEPLVTVLSKWLLLLLVQVALILLPVSPNKDIKHGEGRKREEEMVKFTNHWRILLGECGGLLKWQVLVRLSASSSSSCYNYVASVFYFIILPL